jgi:hypothetical protein
MARRPKPKPDDPEQSKRFIKAARELGADETDKDFERVFKKIIANRRGPSTVSAGSVGVFSPRSSRKGRSSS